MIKLNISEVEYVIYEKQDLSVNRESVVQRWLELAEATGYRMAKEKIEEGFSYTDIVSHAYKDGKLLGSIWATNQPELGAHYYCERFLFHDTRNFRTLFTLALTLFQFLTLREGRDVEISFISRKHTIVRLMGLCGEIMGVSHLEQDRFNYQGYIDKVAKAKCTTPPQLVEGVLKDIYPERLFEKGDYPESAYYTVRDGSFIIMKVYQNFQGKVKSGVNSFERMALDRVRELNPLVKAHFAKKVFDLFSFSREIEYLKASDYSIFNILAWKDYRQVEYHPLSQGVLISVVEQSGERYFWAPLGVESLTGLMGEIRQKGKELQIEKMLKVPEHLLAAPDDYPVDRDNCDYIYLPQELLELPRHCARKRKELLQWQTQEPVTKMMTVKDFRELDRFYRENYDIDGTLKWEYRAFKRFFNLLAERDDVVVIIEGAYIENRLVGFIVAEERDEDVIIHFLKIQRGIKGVSFGIIYDFASSINLSKYINCMQDLGIEGLKYFKSSLRPHRFIKKYTVELNR